MGRPRRTCGEAPRHVLSERSFPGFRSVLAPQKKQSGQRPSALTRALVGGALGALMGWLAVGAYADVLGVTLRPTLSLGNGTGEGEGNERGRGLTPSLSQPDAGLARTEGAINFPVMARPKDWLPNQAGCADATRSPPWQQLALGDAIEFVLCQSPALRQALATIDEQRGTVNLGELAYLPRVSANAELSQNRIPLNNSAASATGASFTGAIGLSWTLFDFGQRDATLATARAALAAAISSQDNVLLQTLSDVLRVYVDAASAWARLDASTETERITAITEEIATARHSAMVGTLLEKLQAQTARSQAALERVRAQAAWDAARGALASAMGRPVSQPMTLAPKRGLQGLADDTLRFATVREEALVQHPRLRALRLEREAARARLDAVRADGKGVLGLNSSLGVTRGLGSGATNDRALGASLSASVPLFNKSEQQARELQVTAQISSREAAIIAAEREIELELWRATQQASGESENVRASRSLLSNAETAYNIALGRFKSGVGSMLEMLSAQSALSSATAAATQAEITALAARIRLSLAVGRMQLAK